MLALSRFLLASSLVSASFAAIHTVTVGKDGLKFTPDFITAPAGDEIIFEFYPKNHTLTQSTLKDPCAAVEGGGDSDYIPVAATATARPTKRMVVPDATTPLWFFCKQADHCSKGMVFAVNPKSPEQMAEYRANALATAPGGAAPPATPATPPPAPAAGKVIPVQVGQGGLTFSPEKVTASVGDVIALTFRGGAHTFTQSSFTDPCDPLAGGVDSGSKPVAGQAVAPTFNYTVTDASKPLWFYCKTGNHCKSGMVFSINAPATGNTHEAFKALAIGAPAAPAAPATSSAPPAQPSAPAPPPAQPNGAPAGGAATGKEIAVTVGQGGLTFNPEKIDASVGDIIVLTFLGGAHTFTQSTFADPCAPMANGIDSGAKPVAGLSTPPTFNYTVTDTSKPLWFYCKTGEHCKAGMVLSINAPPSGNTHEAFKALAMGGPAPAPASESGSASAPNAPGTPPPTPSTTPTAPQPGQETPSVSDGILTSTSVVTAPAQGSNAAGAASQPAGSAPSTGASVSGILLAALFAGLVL